MEFAAATAKPQNQHKDASPSLHRTPLSPLTSASSKTSFRTDPDDAPHYLYPLKEMHNYTPNEVDPHQMPPPTTTAAAAIVPPHHPHHPHHLAPMGSFPSSVSVVCGPIRGTLLVSRCKVVLDPGTAKEREVTPTEFERLGGRAATKKWKQSIRVLAADGTPGRPIGDWLSSIGLDLRANNPASATSGMRRLDGSDPSGARAAYSVEDAHDMMASHLHGCYVGLNPGDPTFTSLPRGFSHPPHLQAYHHTYDVSQMAYKDLLHLAAQRSNGGQPIRALLQPPPGILAQREAYLTGQAPSRRRAEPLPDSAQVMSELASYLAGQTQDPPWRLLRATRAPVVEGKAVDLRELYFMVKKLGGFDEVTAQKAWGGVGQALHLPPADTCSYVLRNSYQRFLLRFERQELALGRYTEEAAARQSGAPQRAAYDGSAQPLGLEQHGAAEDDAGLLLPARHEQLRMGADRAREQQQQQHMEADADVSAGAVQYGDDSDEVQLVGEMLPLPRTMSADRGLGAAAALHRRSSGSLFSEPGALPYSSNDAMAYDAPAPAAPAARHPTYTVRGESMQAAGLMDHHRGGSYAHMEGLSIFSRQPSANMSSSYQYSAAADPPATGALLSSSHGPSQSGSFSDHNLALRQAYATHHAATTRATPAPSAHDLHRTASDQLLDDGGYGAVYASTGGYQSQSMAMPAYSASGHAHSQRGGVYASYQDPHYPVQYSSGLDRLAAAEAYQAASLGGGGGGEPAGYSQHDASRLAAAYRQQQQQQAHMATLQLKRATPDSDMSMPDSAKRHHL